MCRFIPVIMLDNGFEYLEYLDGGLHFQQTFEARGKDTKSLAPGHPAIQELILVSFCRHVLNVLII